ncbi:MAG: protein tyrosine phosphatase [Gemmatimonadetes bacterium]|nr:protein tyrosine phosphatase [Gemmatimonadota bacterium]
MESGEVWPKILFVCSVNKLRSRTAEEMFRGMQGFYVRSRGTEPDARVRVTAGDIGWADVVFVMEKRHRDRLRQKYRQECERKRIVVLHVPDDYDFMDPELVELLKQRLGQHLSVPAWDADG